MNHCAPDDDATVKRLAIDDVAPTIVNLDDGDDEPTPILPLAKIVRSPIPDDDATWNGLTFCVDVACTLKTNDEDVALIPVTTPLSNSDEVPRVFVVNQRVAYPNVPPATPDAVTPRVDVATHFVDVPVVWRIIPAVPVELRVS